MRSAATAAAAAAAARRAAHCSAAASSTSALVEEASAALQRSVTPAVAASLQRDGYAVVDGVYGASLTARLRAEVLALRDAGALRPNASFFVAPDGSRSALEKRGVWEAEAHTWGASAAACAPLLCGLSRDRTLQLLLSVYAAAPRAETLTAQTLKVQLSERGCFPLHADSEEGVDSRRVTCLTYLNPGWRPEAGGELVLYPLPSRRVLVAPRDDRLVLFSATRLIHRVLPSLAPQRVCFTTWLFAREAQPRLPPPPPPPPPPGPRPAASEGALLAPALAPHTAKAALAAAWARSLEEAHPPSAAREAALATLRRDVERIERALAQRFEGSGRVLEELRRRCGDEAEPLRL